jgi:hypothetical protein
VNASQTTLAAAPFVQQYVPDVDHWVSAWVGEHRPIGHCFGTLVPVPIVPPLVAARRFTVRHVRSHSEAGRLLSTRAGLTIAEAHDDVGAELVLECREPATGYYAFVVIHSTVRGPTVGGIRSRTYPHRMAALADAVALARSMSYKSALADLPFGGGSPCSTQSNFYRLDGS